MDKCGCGHEIIDSEDEIFHWNGTYATRKCEECDCEKARFKILSKEEQERKIEKLKKRIRYLEGWHE